MNVCLQLTMLGYNSLDTSALDTHYKNVLKPLLSVLYANPNLAFSFALDGMQLDYYAQHYPEAMLILAELTSRQQVEMLGGGYYAPLFPLLFPADRGGQIEKLTSLLRSKIGKRPRGIALFGSIWSPSVITTFQSYGIEYAELSCDVIPPKGRTFLPAIMAEQGKTIKIIPSHADLCPQPAEPPQQWLQRLKKSVLKAHSSHADVSEAVCVIPFLPEQLQSFISLSYLDTCLSVASREDAELCFVTPQRYLKGAKHFVSLSIPAGMDASLSKWGMEPYKCIENKTHFPVSIMDYITVYPQLRALYARMMYVSLLITQCHGGDKMRKLAAQEKVQEAQCGHYFLHAQEGLPALEKEQATAYRLLAEAEALMRKAKEFGESVTSFDYNADGLNEYICHMENYNAVISVHGAQILELSVATSKANYAGSPSFVNEFDGFADSYQRGFFVEHFIEAPHATTDAFVGVGQARTFFSPQKDELFAKNQFIEKKFDIRKKEIALATHGAFGAKAQDVSLLKKYTVLPNGFTVQYILKNESTEPLKGIFVMEINLAQTCFEETRASQYSFELILNGAQQRVPQETEHYCVHGGVSLLQITDTAHNIQFVFEPNEEAGFLFSTAHFMRPHSEQGVVPSSCTKIIQFFWTVELPADFFEDAFKTCAIEKYVNVTLFKTKKPSAQ